MNVRTFIVLIALYVACDAFLWLPVSLINKALKRIERKRARSSVLRGSFLNHTVKMTMEPWAQGAHKVSYEMSRRAFLSA